MYDATFVAVLAFQVRMAEELPDVLRVRVTEIVLAMPPPVIVIVPLLVPTVAVAVFTLTFILPLLDAEVGLTVSQLPLVLTVHDVLDMIDSD